MSEAEQATDGRDFFNTFFSSALGRANLEDESLAGPSTLIPPAATSSLECGNDPGPSTEDMEAYIKTKQPAKSKDNSVASTQPRRRAAQNGILVDDSKSNFEDAVERRLAATMSSKMHLSHDEEDVYETQFDASVQGLRGSSRSGTRTPVADKDGLGWPAKGSLIRMKSTADQTAQTTAKLSQAVKTILECLGEDPEREGLKRTPERYAKALLWMTRGYEERLSGE